MKMKNEPELLKAAVAEEAIESAACVVVCSCNVKWSDAVETLMSAVSEEEVESAACWVACGCNVNGA